MSKSSNTINSEIDADCVWDASSLRIPDRVREALPNLARIDDGPSLEQLREAVKCPQLTKYGNEILHHIQNKDYLLIRRFPFDDLNARGRRMLFLFLADSCGVPISHIPGGRAYVWDITPRDVQRPFPTYSEHNLEASLHTDSNYREKPEEFVAFLMERPANCGGGQALLLRIAPVLRELEETEEGRRCLNILRSQTFPSLVPSVYSEKSSYVEAPIIIGATVRFRPDTIDMAMDLVPESKTPERLWALAFFSRLLDQSPDRITVTLSKGELLFINNYTVLHGRTEFDDRSRLLLRVRFDRRN